MSFIIEFPQRADPCNSTHPPFVWFAINGQDVTEELPKRIPARIVLSFMPQLHQCIVPDSDMIFFGEKYTNRRISLLEPHIGMHIDMKPCDVSSFKQMIDAMLQQAGVAPARDNILLKRPTLTQLVCLHRTWTAFGLPEFGIESSNVAMLIRLMDSDLAVSCIQQKIIYYNYPRNHRVIDALLGNFFRAAINLQYTDRQFASILYFWLGTTESWRTFTRVRESYDPAFTAAKTAIEKNAARVAAIVLGEKKRKKPRSDEISQETLDRLQRKRARAAEFDESVKQLSALVETRSSDSQLSGSESSEAESNETESIKFDPIEVKSRDAGSIESDIAKATEPSTPEPPAVSTIRIVDSDMTGSDS